MEQKKTHGVPALLSLFVPGLGQVVKGQWLKGIGIWIGLAICSVLMFVIIGYILAPILWLWQIYDAYND